MHNISNTRQHLFKLQGFSRVMAGPARTVSNISRVESDQVERSSELWGSGRIGSDREIFKIHGSGRVRSRGFEISRVGSGHFNPTQPVKKQQTVDIYTFTHLLSRHPKHVQKPPGGVEFDLVHSAGFRAFLDLE